MGLLNREKRKILMIDDVTLNHLTARDVLSDTYEIYDAYSAKEGFDILSYAEPDLILLDIVMPEMSGMEMLDIIKSNPQYKNIPVIFLTAETRPESEVEGFNKGIVDYITKPFVPVIMKKRIATQIALSEYERFLEDKIEKKVREVEQMYDIITTSFAGLVESRDGITGGHLKNTSIYFSAFINYLKDEEEYKSQLTGNIVKKACRCAPLHDVGKIAIKDSILQKPESLTNQEFDYMKIHSIVGGELFNYLENHIPDEEFAKIAAQITRYHHERWDGNGYPDKLKGEDIPLLARIMSIVDVYDALTSKRPYKEPYTHEKAMAIIAAASGSQFDPNLIKHFMNMGDSIKECLDAKEEMIEQKEYFSVREILSEETMKLLE